MNMPELESSSGEEDEQFQPRANQLVPYTHSESDEEQDQVMRGDDVFSNWNRGDYNDDLRDGYAVDEQREDQGASHDQHMEGNVPAASDHSDESQQDKHDDCPTTRKCMMTKPVVPQERWIKDQEYQYRDTERPTKIGHTAYLDSGATTHFLKAEVVREDEHNILQKDTLTVETAMKGANTMTSLGSTQGKIIARSPGSFGQITLTHISVLADLKDNLLSIGQLVADGYLIKIMAGALQIIDGQDQRVVIEVEQIGNLYPVLITEFQTISKIPRKLSSANTQKACKDPTPKLPSIPEGLLPLLRNEGTQQNDGIDSPLCQTSKRDSNRGRPKFKESWSGAEPPKNCSALENDVLFRSRAISAAIWPTKMNQSDSYKGHQN